MGYILFLQGLKPDEFLSNYGTAKSRALTLVLRKETFSLAEGDFFRNPQKPTP
jgi:hypothetical protein